MKKLLLGIFGCFVIANAIFAQTLSQRYAAPIKGTWLNLVYQDVRNKYTNPHDIDNTNAELWRVKVTELAQMGVEYLVIVAVANEGKSFYPSKFMKHAYKEGTQSPVEAIMETADKYGMKVFMSSGWAQSMDDDIKKPEIKAIQRQIMLETAELFQDHPSFYGWYLPVEDSVEPILSDVAVEAVNHLVDEANKLTPGKKVMISPYGFCFADVASDKFRDQIRRLKVDIIAYQDEVGCVREPLPMRRMKEHFAIAKKIHEGTSIEFWANNESFTWEEGTNSRESALIPAAFPRYLSQMVGVTQAGAAKSLSFAVCGIIDSPLSEYPIAQPLYASRMYRDYMDWINGRGRWSLLEATFAGKIKSGVAVTTVVGDKKVASLNDNKFGNEDPSETQWIELGADGEMAVDLGRVQSVNKVAVRFLNYAPKQICLPSFVEFWVSKDGKSYKSLGVVEFEQWANNLHDCWIDIAEIASAEKLSARYIKIKAVPVNGNRLMVDEVLVNPMSIK